MNDSESRTFNSLPPMIQRATIRIAKKGTPVNTAMKRPGSRELWWKSTSQLNVGELLQAEERHKRLALRAIEKLETGRGTASTINTAGDHVHRANYYSELYQEALGKEVDLAALAFPIVREAVA